MEYLLVGCPFGFRLLAKQSKSKTSWLVAVERERHNYERKKRRRRGERRRGTKYVENRMGKESKRGKLAKR